MARVGLFGGTFDPPHLGHIIVAQQVRQELGLTCVRFVVANDPWQKTGQQSISSPIDRFDMVAAAIADIDGLEPSAIELELGGASYTATTLQRLHEQEPDTEWVLILGADTAAGLQSWHQPEEVARLASIVVVDRPSAPISAGNVPPAGFAWQRVEVDPVRLSSTTLRQRVSNGQSNQFLTPDPVIALIEERGLYRHEV